MKCHAHTLFTHPDISGVLALALSKEMGGSSPEMISRQTCPDGSNRNDEMLRRYYPTLYGLLF